MKKKGNILIISTLFLSLSLIFFLGIYKVLEIKVSEQNKIFNRGALDLDRRKEYIVKRMQEYANELEKIDLNKKYSYPDKLVDSKLAIGSLKMEFLEEEVLLSYINTGSKENNEFKVYYKKEILCSCKETECLYKKERFVFIPQRRVKI